MAVRGPIGVTAVLGELRPSMQVVLATPLSSAAAAEILRLMSKYLQKKLMKTIEPLQTCSVRMMLPVISLTAKIKLLLEKT